MKLAGFKELIINPLNLKLSLPLEWLLKNNMIFESVKLCLICIEQVENLRKCLVDHDQLLSEIF